MVTPMIKNWNLMENILYKCQNLSRILNFNFYSLQREKSVWRTEVGFFYLFTFLSEISFE